MVTRVAGIDFSSHAVDVVTVPLDAGAPVWHRFPLTGMDAFDRARSVGDSVPGRSSVFWEELCAVGVEHPAGKFGVGPLLRIQGAILARIPARMLVEPFPPAKWRKAVGLAGNASKEEIALWAIDSWCDAAYPLAAPYCDGETQDTWDAYCIALATRAAITIEKAA